MLRFLRPAIVRCPSSFQCGIVIERRYNRVRLAIGLGPWIFQWFSGH
jgi:hypothetical protein